jgi:hypothetical protein
MIYITWEWDTPHTDEPILTYVELDDARREQRTVSIYRDGRKGFASATILVGDRPLSPNPFPQLEMLNAHPDVTAREISAKEFEAAWNARHE